MVVAVSALIMLVMLFVDLITKAWAAATNVYMTVIPGFMNFRYVKNEGISFGMFQDNSTAMLIITIFTVVMMAVLAVLFFTIFRENRHARIAIAFIEAGAIGNFIDRIFLGYVRDFIDISRIGFGVCNIADFCITFGAVALVIIVLFVGKDAVFPSGKYRKQTETDKTAELFAGADGETEDSGEFTHSTFAEKDPKSSDDSENANATQDGVSNGVNATQDGASDKANITQGGASDGADE